MQTILKYNKNLGDQMKKLELIKLQKAKMRVKIEHNMMWTFHIENKLLYANLSQVVQILKVIVTLLFKKLFKSPPI